MGSTPLIYRRSAPRANAQGSLISLHGLGGDIGQLAPLHARLDLPLDVIETQAWRARNPRQYAPSEHLGYLWFFSHRPGRPEPATFGDAIWAVEQFVYDLLEDQGVRRPLFLLGYDQGATLALTMAALVPEMLAGVAAIGGCLPAIPGWRPPDRDLEGLPMLLVHDPEDPEITAERAGESAGELERRGGRVELRSVTGASRDAMAPAELLDGWFATRLARTAA